MSGRFTGKVFLVTGASSGIGEFIAQRLAADDAHVVLAARRSEQLSAVKAAIEAQGGRASVKVMDVTKYEDVEKTVASIVGDMGRLDGAFNNAGGSGPPGPIADMDVAEFKRVFELNFYGTYHCLKAQLQIMTKQGFGSIVINGSVVSGQQFAGLASYGASKAAMKYLQDSAALEVAAHGVRVNTVSPGFCRPGLMDDFLDQYPEMEAVYKSPQGRMVHAQDVYHAVAFLLDANTSGSMTGADMPISGGTSVPQVTLSKL